MTKHVTGLIAAAVLAGWATQAVAEEWAMPTPYPDATFHTQNIMQFMVCTWYVWIDMNVMFVSLSLLSELSGFMLRQESNFCPSNPL